MSKRHIIVGQKIDPMKLDRARELRRSMTEAERQLWECLRGHRLNGIGFRRQQVIAGFIADFYSATAGIVIEVDGDVHFTQKEYDLERDDWLKAHNLIVLRFTNDEVIFDLENVLEKISSICGVAQVSSLKNIQ